MSLSAWVGLPKGEDGSHFQYLTQNVRKFVLISYPAGDCVVPLKKYQQILDTSCGMCLTMALAASFTTATANGSW